VQTIALARKKAEQTAYYLRTGGRAAAAAGTDGQ